MHNDFVTGYGSDLFSGSLNMHLDTSFVDAEKYTSGMYKYVYNVTVKSSTVHTALQHGVIMHACSIMAILHWVP